MKYILLILLAGFAITTGVVYQLALADRSTVTITTLPDLATISQSSSSFSTKSGTVHLNPGVYMLTASAEGFADSDILIDTASSQQYIAQLEPESDQAIQWYEDNKDQVQDYEALSGQIISEAGEQFRQKNPIVNHLPYRTFLFTIGYQRDTDRDKDSIILTIDAPDIYLSSALRQIEKWGYHASDYNIIYTQGNDREFKK